MKKIIFILSVSVILLGCGNNRDENSIHDQIKMINEKCPKMLDPETRIDGVEFREGKTLIYKYTLINLDARNLDTAMFRTAMWPGIISTVKLNPSLQKIRQLETTVLYVYNDKNGRNAYTFTITPADYK